MGAEGVKSLYCIKYLLSSPQSFLLTGSEVESSLARSSVITIFIFALQVPL